MRDALLLIALTVIPCAAAWAYQAFTQPNRRRGAWTDTNSPKGGAR